MRASLVYVLEFVCFPVAVLDVSSVISQRCGIWSGKELGSAGLVINVQRKVMYRNMMFSCCCVACCR